MELLGMVSVPAWLLLPIFLWAAFYWYYTRNYGIWEKQGIREVRPKLLLGGFVDTFIKCSVNLEREKYEKYGRLYGTFEGNRPLLSVAEPELVKTFLVKDFHAFHSGPDLSVGSPIVDLMMALQQGENWKRVRSIITPTFTSGKMRKMAVLVQELVEIFLQNLLKEAESGKSLDFIKQYSQLTLAVIARCAFGMKVENMKDDTHPFVVNARKMFSSRLTYRLILQNFFPKLVSLLNIEIFPSESLNYFKTITKSIMQERIQMKQKSRDFLQLIIDAQEGTLDMTGEDPTEQSHFDVGSSDSTDWKISGKKKFVSEDEALAQCVLFLAAGVDTTSTALSCISYDLALNPDCQEKLIKEVDAFWEETKGAPDPAAIARLSYLDSVISESLRLHTMGSRLERVAQEDYVLPGKDINIPKGTKITVPVSAIHWDPEWYPRPEMFDPERFSPENRKARNPYTFMPFGAGPRNCVASRFALLEMKLTLVYLLRHIRFSRSADTMVPLKLRPAGVLVFPSSVVLNVEKRHDNTLSS